MRAMQTGCGGQRGLSLIELMIAVALGALILLGTVLLFQQSRTSSAQDEQIARMQENGRYALRMLARELAMVGYWGGMLDVTDSSKVDDTGASAGDDCLSGGWMFKLWPGATYPSVTFTDDATASPYASCIADTEVLDGTDVLAVKRVADQPDRTISTLGVATGSTTDSMAYFKTNTVVGALFEASGASDSGPVFVPNPASIYQYYPSVIYVRPYSTATTDGIPTLVRETLVGDDMVAQPLVEGVENLQIEFGVDGTDTNLAADYYTATPTATELRNAVSARIHVLVRAISPVPGYLNDKTYNLGSTAVAATNDAYYRRVYSTTVQMRNADKLKLYALN